MNTLIHGDCYAALTEGQTPKAECVFADPPDNIGLDYDEHDDKMNDWDYLQLMRVILDKLCEKYPIVWWSFNAKWTLYMGEIGAEICCEQNVRCKPCVQTFTFGQHNHHDFGNNHRPLWRFSWPNAKFYPDAIRIPSWRQENGDPRADPRGRVPGDVFDFPRVTGNSKQRRPWHKTQLNEGLVERCVLFSTLQGETVMDPFLGTGTTARVCARLGRNCIGYEKSAGYCEKMRADPECCFQ